MQSYPVPFGPWLPDIGENENPGLTVATNVVSRPGGYEPFGGGTITLDSVDDGAIQLTDPISVATFLGGLGGGDSSSGDVAILVAGNNRVWYLKAPVSLAGDPVSQITPQVAVVNDPWVFAQFGRNAIISNAGEAYYIDLSDASPSWNTLTLPSGTGRVIAVIEKFLLVSGDRPSNNGFSFTFRTSAFNDFTDFTISETTQAGEFSVDNEHLGPITAIVGGRTPLLFQKRGVTRLAYVGPPRTWVDTLISSEMGAVSPTAVATHDDIVYFMSDSGVCATDGASVSRIGKGKVDEWLVKEFIGLDRDIELIRTVVDPSRRLVIWSLPNRESSVADCSDFDNHLVYSIETDSFSLVEGTFQPFYAHRSPNSNFSAERLFAFTKADGETYSEVRIMNGSNLAAEIRTGFGQLVPDQRTAIINVEPVFSGAGAKVAVDTKLTQAGSITAGTPVALNANGIADVRADGRLVAVSVEFDAGETWGNLKGAIVTGDVSGAR